MNREQRKRKLSECVLLIGIALGLTGPACAGLQMTAHWPMNEGSGTRVADVVGGHDGELVNGDASGANWIEGTLGGAMCFTVGTQPRVVVPHVAALDFDDVDFSISMMIRYPAAPATTEHEFIVKGTTGSAANPGTGKRYTVFDKGTAMRFEIDDNVVKTGLSVSNAAFITGEWVHLVVIRDTVNNQLSMYADGVLQGTTPDLTGGIANGEIMTIGNSTNFSNPCEAYIDDVRIFAKALTADEVVAIYGSFRPEDGATDVDRDVVLSWSKSESAVACNVYFGTSRTEVGNAGAGSPLLVGQRIEADTFAAGRLEYGQTYYWRVDEIGAPPESKVLQGEVRSFTVEPFSRKITASSITATASSVFNADSGPQKTVDESGLNASDQHDTTGANMWASAIGQQPPVWIQYQFDKIYKLDQMWVWNSNQTLEPLVGFGVKTATIEYSVDGVNWTALSGVPEFKQAPGEDTYAHDTEISFGGIAAQFVKMTFTASWSTRAQYGLSEVRFFHVPVAARDPDPASGATGVSLDAALTWRPGRDAAEHLVYLSTDRQAVTSGAAPTTIVTQASYRPSLNVGVTYYWRVDEVNAATAGAAWAGSVWSFTTIDHLVVDDMESYNDTTQPVYSTWIDGYGTSANGGLAGNDVAPYMSTTTFHGGRQSMPFRYSITGTYTLAEATRTFAAAQDWTRSGIKTLVVYFYGAAANSGQLYVKINGTKIPYGGAATDVAKEAWTAWEIDLTSRATLVGSVSTLTIGVDGIGAAGTLYVDDIGLK